MKIIDQYTFCPACGEQRSRYQEIPPSRLSYRQRESGYETEAVHHFGELLDYKCDNCDHEWLMSAPQEG